MFGNDFNKANVYMYKIFQSVSFVSGKPHTLPGSEG